LLHNSFEHPKFSMEIFLYQIIKRSTKIVVV
jgi:hypothetical protein